MKRNSSHLPTHAASDGEDRILSERDAPIHRGNLDDPHDVDHEAMVPAEHTGQMDHEARGDHGDHADIFRRRF